MSKSSEISIGSEIGNYRIAKELEQGGSGTVYLAEHTILTGRLVAIKLLHAHLAAPEDQAQFLQEAQILERLKHPHILPVHDVGFFQSTPYLMTEYAPGGSLRDRLDRQGGQPLLQEEVLTLLSQVGQALAHAHTEGIVHRDLKPENILFNAKGEALLADFGIALEVKNTSVKERTIVGSFDYMAPEQIKGIISKEGDQYALGCIAYELLTGHVPFEATDVRTLLAMHISALPDPPTTYNPRITDAVEQAILRTLEKERGQRFPTVQDFLTALSSPASSASPPSATAPSVAPSPTGKTTTQWVKEGRELLQDGHPKKAFDAFEQALRLDPNDLDANLYRGKAAYSLNYYRKGLESYEQVLAQQSKHLESLIGKADCLSALKRHGSALQVYDEALALSPQNSSLHYRRGKQLAHLKRYQDAVGAFEEAIRLKPTVAEYFYEEGKALVTLKRYQEALAAFEKAVQLKPLVISYRHEKAKALISVERYDEGLKLYDQLLREDFVLGPLKAELLKEKGDAFYTLKRYGEALAAYNQALRASPKEPDILFCKGNALFSLYRYDEAVEVYDQVIKKRGYYGIAYVNKGLCLYNLKRYEEAATAYRGAIKLFERGAKVYRGLGNSLQNLGRYDEAIEAYEVALESIPYDVNLVLNRAICLEQLELYTDALDAYQQTLVLDPSITRAYRGIGDIALEDKKYWQAFQAYHKAIQFGATDALLFRKRLMALRLLSPQESLQAYDLLIAQHPRDVDWYLEKGRLLLKLQKPREALTVFDQALVHDPSSFEAQQKKQQILQQLAVQYVRLHPQTPAPVFFDEDEEDEDGELEEDEEEDEPVDEEENESDDLPAPIQKQSFWKRLWHGHQ